MKEPVKRTSKRTIWPVLIEVVLLNMIFGLAINALPNLVPVTNPDYQVYEIGQKLASDALPKEVMGYRDTAVKLLAEHSAGEIFGSNVGKYFALFAGIVFGLLLLSAVNTAIMAKVSVMYSMGHDGELPRHTTKLNYSGVPWVPLIIACLAPIALLLIEADAKALGELYAIGVVGAICINFLCCAANKKLEMKTWERSLMWAFGVFMTIVELTICVAKPHAAAFAGGMIAWVLVTRWVVHLVKARRAAGLIAPMPADGWMAELQREPLAMDPSRPKIMLAARGRGQSEFAVDLARRRGATLFVIYVRTLRVMDIVPGAVPQVQDDRQALESLGGVAILARKYRVPLVPIYVCATDVSAEILDYTVTFGCDTLIMGKTKRRAFARVIEGDVITEVVRHLPSEVALITRDSSPHPMGPEPEAMVIKPSDGPRPTI